MIISDDRLQKALRYLAETDEPFAAKKSYMEGLKEQSKTIHAVEFLSHDGPVESRKAKAYISSSYKEHLKKVEQAVLDYEIIRNKRLTNQLIVDTWRSLNANRRNGNL